MKNNEEIIIELLTEIRDAKKAERFNYQLAEKIRREQRSWMRVTGGCAFASLSIILIAEALFIPLPFALLIIVVVPLLVMYLDSDIRPPFVETFFGRINKVSDCNKHHKNECDDS